MVTFSRLNKLLPHRNPICNKVSVLFSALPDKEPAELDVLHEPRTLLPEAEEMGSVVSGLQASAGHGQEPGQGSLLPGSVSDGDGFIR